MMPLPAFELARPRQLDEASRLLAEAGGEGRVLAGGTDLLVNLKHGLAQPRLLVSVDRLAQLRGVFLDDAGRLVVGAGEHLSDVAQSSLVRARAPSLAEATRAVAHPQARNMGTLGGNLCLDVRCHYVNRTPLWRGALGGCLKADGDVCHVVPKGQNCMAALSGDTIAPLVSLGAEVQVVAPAGERWLPVEALRGKDGRTPVTLAAGEIVRAIRVPVAPPHRRSAYLKWAVRRAVDFPLVSVALVCDAAPDGRIEALTVVASVLGPRPRTVTGLERFTGERLTPALASAIAERVTQQCVPLSNVLYDASYRRRRLGVMVRRQLESWSAS